MTEAEKAYQYFVIAVPENEEQAKAYFWARKALRPTLTPPNEPLTLDELRQMDRFSHPIWDECLHEWCAVRPDVCAGEQGISYLGGGSRPLESGRFYRRPPEGEEEN